VVPGTVVEVVGGLVVAVVATVVRIGADAPGRPLEHEAPTSEVAAAKASTAERRLAAERTWRLSES